MRTLAMTFLMTCLLLVGCSTAMDRWQTSMTAYTAANNIAADLYEMGKIDHATLVAYRTLGRSARAALDAWAITISPDGRTDDGSARAAAEAALNAVKQWLAIRTRKQ